MKQLNVSPSDIREGKDGVMTVAATKAGIDLHFEGFPSHLRLGEKGDTYLRSHPLSDGVGWRYKHEKLSKYLDIIHG